MTSSDPQKCNITYNMYEQVSNILCVHLQDHRFPVDTQVTKEIIMIVTLQCKDDLLATIELFPNQFDKYSKDEQTFFNERIQVKEKFPIGDLAFWDNSQKILGNKHHGIIERIEKMAWTCYYDQHVI